MRHTKNEDASLVWPPDDGVAFIRTEAFGSVLVHLVLNLARKYPRMDFADAIAKTYTWLDGKLAADPRFIDTRRFPRQEAFIAYLRQAVWNAARLAERERRRHKEVRSLPIGQDMIIREIAPEELSELVEAVESLPELNKTVFHRHFFDEESLSFIASVYNLTESEAHDLYIQAIDILRRQLFADSD